MRIVQLFVIASLALLGCKGADKSDAKPAATGAPAAPGAAGGTPTPAQGAFKVGDECSGITPMPQCTSATTLVECDYLATKKYHEVQCKGPNGCKSTPSESACDISGNKEGDACPAKMSGRAVCSADGKSKAACRIDSKTKTFKVFHEECPGPQGCYIKGMVLECDQKK